MSLVAFSGLPEVQRREYISEAGLDTIIAEFSGATRTEQLLRGNMAARQALQKYTSTFGYNQTAADEIFDRVETWQRANGTLLNQYISKGADTVPEQVALGMGAEAAKQYILASYATAATGLKGWAGGAVVRAITSATEMTYDRAEIDSEARLLTFATIVKLDRDGGLGQIFSDKYAASGFGLAFLAAIPAGGWVLLSAIAVSTIAAFAILNYCNSQTEQTNKLIDKLCERDPEGCNEVLSESIRTQIERSSEGGFVGDATRTIAAFVGIGVVLVIGVKYVLPPLLDVIDKSRERAT